MIAPAAGVHVSNKTLGRKKKCVFCWRCGPGISAMSVEKLRKEEQLRIETQG